MARDERMGTLKVELPRGRQNGGRARKEEPQGSRADWASSELPRGEGGSSVQFGPAYPIRRVRHFIFLWASGLGPPETWGSEFISWGGKATEWFC